MTDSNRALVAAALIAFPWMVQAQHSHGGGGMDLPPRHEKHERPPPPSLPKGLLPPGSARQIEVLVLDYGFSPTEIRADKGEEVILTVRRSDEGVCKAGLAIPAKQVLVQLPVGETIPVTLKLDRTGTIEVGCASEDVKAAIIVAPR